MIKLSILDQSPVRAGGSHAQAIAETLELAQTVDRLGYSRYWVAEHHNSFGLACTVPEILISRIASMTSRLLYSFCVQIYRCSEFISDLTTFRPVQMPTCRWPRRAQCIQFFPSRTVRIGSAWHIGTTSPVGLFLSRGPGRNPGAS